MHRTAREPAPDSHSPGARMTPGTPRTLRAITPLTGIGATRSTGTRPTGPRS
ncbi:hypothetical protein [Clavibacter nebraskensis]|uniref:Uncharacterized protein n=1 Tax=Clavibacter nebraskensis TaxID=31963 RepID=A0ABY4MQU2_9MICO|nr:hypothetical protein [Clavibacter nebraskensis]QKO03355.1 hypothetical protein EGX35_14715 [Clavibacter nebraskensis]QLL36524.1 hypothetical protein EGX36_14755 [Clavibacter nebraskensis]QLL36628.1 hypothetical protein EGX37_14710 [Clavibacter nebraskensis]UQB05625.1 hypothetical protein LIV34_000689 [Clavibacter nebraskensis]UQB08449.1 hypothetical protein LIX21_000689 [Clavibacter nebraskensis]